MSAADDAGDLDPITPGKVRCPECLERVEWLPDLNREVALVCCHSRPCDFFADCAGSLTRVPRPATGLDLS